MRINVDCGSTTIKISCDEDGTISVSSNGHLKLKMVNMGIPGIIGPDIDFDTHQLVSQEHENAHKAS